VRPATDRGVALLEVLVALAILSGAGLALLDLVTAGLRAERESRERERVLAVEDRVLTALTLLTQANSIAGSAAIPSVTSLRTSSGLSRRSIGSRWRSNRPGRSRTW